jgi:peptidoglycan/xylan/chitin deacetylase (PgdA/CDA1 family)
LSPCKTPSNRQPLAGTAFADASLGLFWRTRGLRLLSSRRPVVLMYHRVAPGSAEYFGPDVFEQHILFLRSRFHLIGPREYGRVRRPTEDIEVLLTFDDGFLNNAVHVIPILKRHQVPAVFFISTRHCSSNKFLWFAYLNAFSRWFPEKEFAVDDIIYDLTKEKRKLSVHRLREYLLSLRPHPQAMYDKMERSLPSIESFTPQEYINEHYAGMTRDHIRELARDPLFEVGIHTVDHPFLTSCSDAEMQRQIRENRVDLERVTGKQVRSIAYPSGDYDLKVAEMCRELGVDKRYAVELRSEGRQSATSRDEIPRIGVYKPSLSIVGFKVQWGNLLRRTPLRFG